MTHIIDRLACEELRSKPTKKKLSKTAQALQLISTGLTHRQAANALGITTQSIYRLQSYRKQHPVCPMCGR